MTTSSDYGSSPDDYSLGFEESFEIASDKNTSKLILIQPNQDGDSSVEKIVDKKLPIAPLRKIVTISDEIGDLFDQISARAAALNVDYERMGGAVQLLGNEAAVNELVDFISALNMFLQPVNMQADQDQVGPQTVKRKEDGANKEEGKESEKNEGDLGPYIEREIVLYPALKPYLKEIVTQAEKMQLIHKDLDNTLIIVGFQAHVFDFMTWLDNFTATDLENRTNWEKAMESIRHNSEYKQDEISISAFHRMKKVEILRYADFFNLNCQFRDDVILVIGYSGMINEFKWYLHETEARVMESLYPKYWDFHTVDIFPEIEINALSEEFQEIETLLKQTLPTAIMHKLTRIQNKHLMEPYITMLQKRQELRPESVINKKWLFHGTRTIKPEEIYRNSAIGFDLQFAKANGMYGKGLYFASGANYPHNGYAYNLGNGRFQMILADVFLGNVYKSNPNSALKKAPEGYDSVESTKDGFYVVYNNFHSYPLYLIEYQVGMY